MAQKTVTINGRKYTGKNIADLMDASTTTNDSAGIKFVDFGRVTFKHLGTYPLTYACEYRHDDGDGYFAPVVSSRDRANCIKVECRTYEAGAKWIEL